MCEHHWHHYTSSFKACCKCLRQEVEYPDGSLLVAEDDRLIIRGGESLGRADASYFKIVRPETAQ